jgi:hypothetical protein
VDRHQVVDRDGRWQAYICWPDGFRLEYFETHGAALGFILEQLALFGVPIEHYDVWANHRQRELNCFVDSGWNRRRGSLD